MGSRFKALQPLQAGCGSYPRPCSLNPAWPQDFTHKTWWNIPKPGLKSLAASTLALPDHCPDHMAWRLVTLREREQQPSCPRRDLPAPLTAR